MMDRTITVFRDGAFRTETAPDWWPDDDWPLVFDDDDKMADADTAYGREGGTRVEVYNVPDRGRWVTFWHDGRFDAGAFVATDADYLELLTSRLLQFARIPISDDPTVQETLDKLATAFIAFARHGSGEHIDQEDGYSSIDRYAAAQRRAAYVERRAAAANGSK